MIRSTAFRIYVREWLHALRNRLTPDEAESRAMERVTEAFASDPAVRALSPLEQYERWGEIFASIIDFRLATHRLPIDRAAIPPKEDIDATIFDGVPKPPESLSGEVPVVAGPV